MMSLYNGITIALSLALQESLRCAWDDHQQLDDTNRVSQYWVKWNTPTGCQLNGTNQLDGTNRVPHGWMDRLDTPTGCWTILYEWEYTNRVSYSIGRHQSGVTIFNGQQSGGIINR